MALRHGQDALRVEVLQPDEQPFPVADERPDVSSVKRAADGTVATPEAAAALGARGGRAKAKRVALARTLGHGTAVGLPDTDSPDFAPYRRAARAFQKAHLRQLAALAGGSVGTGPGSLIASAALQLAGSRYLFNLAAGGAVSAFKMASQLANDSRQNILAAYELAIREAKARPQDPGAAHRAIEAAFGTGGAK
jgi:hypothetical protein